jgi:hypothetical protein
MQVRFEMDTDPVADGQRLFPWEMRVGLARRRRPLDSGLGYAAIASAFFFLLSPLKFRVDFYTDHPRYQSTKSIHECPSAKYRVSTLVTNSPLPNALLQILGLSRSFSPGLSRLDTRWIATRWWMVPVSISSGLDPEDFFVFFCSLLLFPPLQAIGEVQSAWAWKLEPE